LDDRAFPSQQPQEQQQDESGSEASTPASQSAALRLQAQLNEVTQELREVSLANPWLRGDALTPVLSAQPPAQDKRVDTKAQKFRGLVQIGAFGRRKGRKLMPALMTLNKNELVLFAGPEFDTSLIGLPIGHIQVCVDADADADADTCFCLSTLMPPSQEVNCPAGEQSKTQSQSPSIFIHLTCADARDAWLAVLSRFRISTDGWSGSAGLNHDHCLLTRPDECAGLWNPWFLPRRLALCNSTPLVIWMPE
jgi:hypothetical protein